MRIAYDIARGHIRWGLDRAGALLGLLSFPKWSRSVRWFRGTLRDQLRRRSEPRLTVAIDIASFWEPLTGIGWYLYRLIEHLATRDDLRLRLYGPSSVASDDLEEPAVPLPSGPAIERVERRVAESLILPRGWLIKWLRLLEPVAIAADGNDVLFAPNYFLPRRFNLATGARVATVHDLGLRRFAWTLRRETLNELNQKFDHAVFEASRLITVSRAIKDEMVAEGLAAAEKITPIHHGPGQLAAVEPGRLPDRTPERFALHVGTIEPRKNVSGLLDAWRHLGGRLPATEERPSLVLCGKFGWKSEEVKTEVQRAEREGWLVHLGYVEDAELAALYRHALVVVFPTLYEGFGLPAVEAMWAQTPLVCSDLPVLREVTGGAALFAPADRPDLFADRVAEVLSDPQVRAGLLEAGRQRTSKLSWQRTASQTAAVWAQAAGGDDRIEA
ncbi:MAG: glycosyltransferase family 4 protein [Thermoanaerobaculia bacterium]